MVIWRVTNASGRFGVNIYETYHDKISRALSTRKIMRLHDMKIYNILGNKELSKNLSNAEIREKTVNALKKELTGISQEGYKV